MSDGCTFWLQGWWRHCCVAHDAAYANGVNKFIADEALRICVDQAGAPIMAWIMFIGVTLFGGLFYRKTTK